MADPNDLIMVAYSPSQRKLYDNDGTASSVDTVEAALARTVPIDNVAAVATANASDLDTAQALANQLKTTVNAILAALKEHGLMVKDAT